MEAGEWVALGTAAVALLIEMVRIRRERDRFDATSRRLDEAEARLTVQETAQFLLELQGSLRQLYEEARAHLRPGNGSYGTEASLRARLVETRKLAEQAEGDAQATSLDFVKECGGIIGWIDRGAREEEKELLRRVVEDAFEAAIGSVVVARTRLRRERGGSEDPPRG